MKQTSEIADCVRRSLERYFKDLDGAKPRAIYDMVMKNVERPMLEIVLDRAAGSASWLGDWPGSRSRYFRRAARRDLSPHKALRSPRSPITPDFPRCLTDG